MKNIFYLIFLFGLLQTQAQPSASLNKTDILGYGSAAEVGISQERLKRIENMIETAIANHEIPGAVILIARNNKIVLHKAFGQSNAQTKQALDKSNIFRIASQTKAITSTAIMMLWEEGLFKLDDPIEKYIPEFKGVGILDTFSEKDSSFTTIPTKNLITIRHLLTHTSGIGYGMIDNDPRMKKIYQKAGIVDAFTIDDYSIAENIKKLAKLPLHHDPGTNYVYSEGIDVLGYLVEILSGLTLKEFLHQRIFEPLDMQDTYFYLPESKADRLVAIQTYKKGHWRNYDGQPLYDADYPIKGAKKFYSGGAGLSSTAKDYAHFLQMYLNGGVYNGHRLLSRTTIEFMMKNQIGELRGDPSKHYGLAFGLVTQKGAQLGGLGSEGTFDWGGYFNTQYFADPNEQVIGILMKQTRDISNDQTRWKFRQMVFSAIDD